MYFFYSIFLLVTIPFGLFYFGGRSWLRGFRQIGQRLGSVSERSIKGSFWMFASSMGEVRAAATLMRGLRAFGLKSSVYLFVMTRSGRLQAEKAALWENVFYIPFDFRWVHRRLIRQLRPQAMMFVEGEWWPNLLREARASHIPTVLVNGRISQEAFHRWLRLPRFARSVVRNLDHAIVQAETDRKRLETLGLEPGKIRVTGNLKFNAEFTESPEIRDRLRHHIGDRPLWVAGSLRRGEGEKIIRAFAVLKRDYPDLVLLVASRHPQKLDDVTDALWRTRFQWKNWTDLDDDNVTPLDAVVLDMLGILIPMYAEADIVFVGGSLVPYGGHNVIEPAYYGKPVITGSHVDNFKDVVDEFARHDAILLVRDEEELIDEIDRLLKNPDARKQLGERAAQVIQSNQHALEDTLQAVYPLVKPLEGNTD